MTAPAAPAPTAAPATPAAPVVTAPAEPAAPVVAPVVPPGVTIAGTPNANTPAAVPTWYADGPEAAQAYVARLTREAAEARVSKQTTDQAAITAAAEAERTRIGRALGYIKDDGANLTPEQLTERHTAQLAEKDKTIRELTIGSALSTALAGTHPGTRDALTGSGQLADLDPAAPDFTTQLQTRVTAYLDANPYFRVTPVIPAPTVPPLTGQTGGDFIGTTVAPPGGDLDIDALRKARAERRAG